MGFLNSQGLSCGNNPGTRGSWELQSSHECLMLSLRERQGPEQLAPQPMKRRIHLLLKCLCHEHWPLPSGLRHDGKFGWASSYCCSWCGTFKPLAASWLFHSICLPGQTGQTITWGPELGGGAQGRPLYIAMTNLPNIYILF